jgi:hypothetical protein
MPITTAPTVRRAESAAMSTKPSSMKIAGLSP